MRVGIRRFTVVLKRSSSKDGGLIDGDGLRIERSVRSSEDGSKDGLFSIRGEVDVRTFGRGRDLEHDRLFVVAPIQREFRIGHGSAKAAEAMVESVRPKAKSWRCILRQVVVAVWWGVVDLKLMSWDLR